MLSSVEQIFSISGNKSSAKGVILISLPRRRTNNALPNAVSSFCRDPHESPHFFTTALAALGAGFVEDLVQSKLEHGRGEGGSVGRASDQSTVVRQCGVWA